SVGVWQFTAVDNTPNNVGTIDSLIITVTPNKLASGTSAILGSVGAHEFTFFPVDVPPNATNLTVTLSGIAPSLPLDLYIRRGDLPTIDTFDKFARITPPGGSLTITRGDIPPLNAGRYFIGVFNPNGVNVQFFISLLIGISVERDAVRPFLSADTPIPIK